MYKRQQLTVIAIILSLIACRPEPLLIDIPPAKEQVVVFSQIIPDQVMTVALTRTIGALDFSEEEGDTLTASLLDRLLVKDAKVWVTYRDLADTLYPVTDGIYVSINTPQFVNEKYTLHVITLEGDSLTAETTMLPLVTFDHILPIIENDEGSLVTLDYKFKDFPENNWYMINIYTNGVANNTEVNLNSLFDDGSKVLKRTELLSDVAFGSEIIEGRLELPNVNPTDSMVVTLSAINETYFQYLELRKNGNNLFSAITKEPISLPTNVEGGLGFFNTHFPDVHYFDLNE